MNPGRNDRCPCGSGRKYKHCCQSRAARGNSAPVRGSVPYWLESGKAHFRQGHFGQAEALCRQVLRVEPNSFDALHLLGLIAHQTGRLNEATRHFFAALKAQPRHAVTHYNLALVLQKQGRIGAAAEYYEYALSLQPDPAHAKANLMALFGHWRADLDADLRESSLLPIGPGRRSLAIDHAARDRGRNFRRLRGRVRSAFKPSRLSNAGRHACFF